MMIILTGMPAVGKSTIGKKIANNLGYEHIDLDQYISLRCKLSINDIFIQKGESFFRNLEVLALKKILKQYNKKLVLSLGGGAFINENSAQLCLNKGLVIWLQQPIHVIYNRIKRKNSHRAILTEDNLYSNLNKLMVKRLPFYKKAHIHIGNHYKNHEIIKVIIDEYNKCKMFKTI